MSKFGTKFNKSLTVILFLMIILWLVITIGCVFNMTVATDEAWILLGIQDNINPPADGQIQNIVNTSGGLHFFIHAIITKIFNNDIVKHRLVSIGFILIIFLWIIFLKHKNEFSLSLIPIALLLSAPGSTYLSSSAYAAVKALFLIILYIEVLKKSNNRVLNWILCGIIGGIAFSTRTQCLVLIPSTILWSFITTEKRLNKIIDSLIISLFSFTIYKLIDNFLRSDSKIITKSTGLGMNIFSQGRVLKHWAILNNEVPFLLLIFIIVFVLYVHFKKNKFNCPSVIIPIFSTLTIMAWIFKSPIPHIRYLWPALAILFLEFGFTIQFALTAVNEKLLKYKNLILVILIISLSGEIGTGLRVLLIGNSNFIGWEYSREVLMTQAQSYKEFRSINDQNDFIKYMDKNIPKGSTIGIFEPGQDLRYITNRNFIFVNLLKVTQPQTYGMPNYLVLSPLIGSFLQISEQTYNWIINNTKLEYSNSSYSIYKITGHFPHMAEKVFNGYIRNYNKHPFTGQ